LLQRVVWQHPLERKTPFLLTPPAPAVAALAALNSYLVSFARAAQEKARK
jgi:hypothetical protein